jgi:hypothetical protein
MLANRRRPRRCFFDLERLLTESFATRDEGGWVVGPQPKTNTNRIRSTMRTPPAYLSK